MPFIGTAAEQTERRPDNVALWDSRPFGAGDPIQSEKGPAMLANEQKQHPGVTRG